MRQLTAIILISFLLSGTIFSPTGNFSCTRYVPEMYERCLEEDDEIEWADFLFEHLLCLESLVEFLEQEDDEPDPYGAPYQLPQTVVQTIVTITPAIKIPETSFEVQATSTHKFYYKNPFQKNEFIKGIFRPPAA